MATGATQSYESFGDYERLAQFFRDYETGWRVVFDVVAPIHGQLLGAAMTYAGPLALIVLAFYTVRHDIESAFKHFLLIVVFTTLLYPFEVSTVGGWGGSSSQADLAEKAAKNNNSSGGRQVRVSLFLYYFDRLTTDGLNILQAAVDTGISSHGKSGDFGAPMGVLAAMSKSYTDLLKDSNLKHAYDDYNNSCSIAAQNLSQDEATSVGLLGGPLGNVSFFNRKAESPKAVDALKGIILNNGLYNKPDGYYLETIGYWDDRLKRTSAERNSQVVTKLLSNEKYPENQYQPAASIPDIKRDDYKYRFFAITCFDLYRIADAGMLQYNGGLARNYAATGSGNSGTGGGPLSSAQNGKAILASSLGQYYLYQNLHTDSADRTGEASNYGRAIAGGAQGLTGGALGFFYNWWSELKVQYFAVLIPGIATATTGLIFVLFPIAALLALFPGRAGLLSNFLYGIVFVKLAVFLAYLIVKFGGLLSTAAIDVMVNSMSYGGTNLASTIIPWVIGGQAITLLSAIIAPPIIAHMLVFNDSAGLKSMRFDKFGAQQLAATAGVITSIATKGALTFKGGKGTAGVLNVNMLSVNANSGSQGNSTSVSANGGSRPSTMNSVASRANTNDKSKTHRGY